MKPIQTKYMGYRFRSRTEARWAVFFDSIGIKWEYEPEGYELSDGDCYLPDFYLPNVRMHWYSDKGEISVEAGAYVEVKPKEFEDAKAAKFSMQAKVPILMAVGAPDYRAYQLHNHHFGQRKAWFACPRLNAFLDTEPTECQFPLTQSGSYLFHERFIPRLVVGQRVIDSINAARSARFEFAEAEQRLAYVQNKCNHVKTS